MRRSFLYVSLSSSHTHSVNTQKCTDQVFIRAEQGHDFKSQYINILPNRRPRSSELIPRADTIEHCDSRTHIGHPGLCLRCKKQQSTTLLLCLARLAAKTDSSKVTTAPPSISVVRVPRSSGPIVFNRNSKTSLISCIGKSRTAVQILFSRRRGIIFRSISSRNRNASSTRAYTHRNFLHPKLGRII